MKSYNKDFIHILLVNVHKLSNTKLIIVLPACLLLRCFDLSRKQGSSKHEKLETRKLGTTGRKKKEAKRRLSFFLFPFLPCALTTQFHSETEASGNVTDVVYETACLYRELYREVTDRRNIV